MFPLYFAILIPFYNFNKLILNIFYFKINLNNYKVLY